MLFFIYVRDIIPFLLRKLINIHYQLTKILFLNPTNRSRYKPDKPPRPRRFPVHITGFPGKNKQIKENMKATFDVNRCGAICACVYHQSQCREYGGYFAVQLRSSDGSFTGVTSAPRGPPECHVRLTLHQGWGSSFSKGTKFLF